MFGEQPERPTNRNKMSMNRVNFMYRAKLQEEMNLVERKRRLAQDAMASAISEEHGAAGIIDDNEQTDGIESEEADPFTRRENFEKLLARFEKHKAENNHLKGNDLRYNVYLKKLDKMSRMDMGLDLAAYKDYVNNLREFAKLNNDMEIFA
jgi:hypothetical protein